jgi:hypothetical protein
MTEASRPRKPHKWGIPNKLTEPLVAPEGTEWGPAMRALPSDRHRLFVMSMYAVPPGHGAGVKAAKAAHFGTTTTTVQSWSVIAWRLCHDQRIQAALREEDLRRIRVSAPRAVSALERLVENPRHKDHVRAIDLMLSRAHPIETHAVITHQVAVDHNSEALQQLKLMKELGVPRPQLEAFFGYNGLPRFEAMLAERDGKAAPKMIEAAAVDVTPADKP